MSNPPSVSNNRPVNQPLPSQVNGAQPAQSGVVAGANRALGEVSEQLTQFLNRVSKRSTTAVDLSDVTALAKNTKSMKKLGEAFDSLQRAAQTAQKQLEHISTFSGDLIADAFDPESNTWIGKAGQQLEAASTALAEVSEQLLKLLNHPKVSANAKLHALIEEKYMKNCCRESELATVLNHVVTLKHGGDELVPSEATRAKLAQSLQDLMAEFAPQMHGTQEALDVEGSQALRNLTRLLGKVKGDDQAMGGGVRKAAVLVARGLLVHFRKLASQEQTIDKSFFREGMALMRTILRKLENLKETAVDSLAERHIKNCIDLPKCLTFSKPLLAGMEATHRYPNLVKYLRMRQDFSMIARELVTARMNPETPKAEVDPLRDRLEELRNELSQFLGSGGMIDCSTEIANLRNEKALPPELMAELPDRQTLNEAEMLMIHVLHTISALRSHVGTLDKILTHCSRMPEADFKTKQLIASLFTQELPISSLIECKVNGIRDNDIDLSLCDDNIAHRKAFGQGGVNTVYEVTMKDGRVFIFKPEVSGRAGLDIVESAKDGYAADANVAALNIAAKDAADFLGLGGCIVSAKVGICNGQLGFFMEKAPGIEAYDFRKLQEDPQEVKASVRNHPISKRRLATLDNADFLKVNGQLMKQCYDLEWADFLIGSGDRHCGNYFVNLSENGSVGIKGIDNDICFPTYRADFTKVAFTGEKLENFLTAILIRGRFNRKNGESMSAAQLLNQLGTLPGITVSEDKTAVTVDLNKVEQPWVRELVSKVTGVQQVVPPRVIDRELYNRLMTLDNDAAIEAYRERLQGRMDEANVEAAVTRLRGAIRHAKELEAKGCIIEHWEELQEQKRVVNLHDAANRHVPDNSFLARLSNRNAETDPRAVNNLYFRDFAAVTRERILALGVEQ